MKPIIVIPACRPGPELEALARALLSSPGRELIIVDDCPAGASSAVFAVLERMPKVHVLRHAANLGKGAALKTAFRYFLEKMPPGRPGAVTADADGQHLPEDIEKISLALEENPRALILGARGFSGTVPARSLIGNAFMRLLFRFFPGRRMQDTQTGLRGVPRDFMAELLKAGARGYEFELEMLLLAFRSRMEIKEIPVTTVYLRDNKHSRFNPLRDSLRIWFVFLKFLAASMLRGRK